MSRDDGEGKPPNPFATPSPGAPNPFADLMGGPPAEAPNPFAGVAPPAPAAAPPVPEGPAITVTRASKMTPPPGAKPAAPDDGAGGGDMMEMLGLDVEERAPPPPQKKIRPELEEWRSEMSHAPATDPGQPLNLAAASNPRIQALPPEKKGGVQKYIAIAVGVLVVVALGGIVPRVLKASGDDAEPAGPQLSETDQLLQLGIRPENAPDCFTRDQGFKFSYADSGGQTVTVNSIADIPPLYRLGARCIPQQ